MHNGIVNKTRYDDLGKLMKQTSFTVKNWRGNLLKNQSTIIKRSLWKSYKTFVLRLYNLNRWTYSRNLILLWNFWTLQYMNTPPTITIRTSNRLQEPLKGFPHSSKFVVVAMTSTSSPMESSNLLWNSLVWWNRENLVTKP